MFDEFGLLEDGDSKSAEINMGPLLDMVFILLIFFVITAQFSEQTSIDINKPSASTAKVTSREPTVIAITANNDIHIHGRMVTEGTLKTILMREKKSTEDLAVLISGDKKSSLESVVKVMDICGNAGITKVSVGAEKKMNSFIVRLPLALIFATLLFAIMPIATMLLKKNREKSSDPMVVEIPKVKKKRPYVNKRSNIDKIPKLESIGTRGLVNIKIPDFEPVLKNEEKDVSSFDDVKVYSEDEVEEVAKPLKKLAPSYPAAAKKAGLTGKVKVRFTVSADGYVTNVRVIETPGEIFSKEIKRSLSEWIFIPAKIDGIAVAQEAKISFSFGLD